MGQGIPTFAADGARLRNRTAESIERLASLGRVTVTRGRQGRVQSARFLPDNQPLAAVPTGQRYSHEQGLPSGHRAWRFSPLIGLEDATELAELGVTPAEAEVYVRSVFFAVQHSVMTPRVRRPAATVPLPAPPSRPPEFDSEARVAA